MLKFRCQHCGQRIAVPARHLGRLVTCAECGRPTHPLAEQIVRQKAPAHAPPAPTPAPGSTCGNCGTAIGRLQSSYPWNGHTVCGPCHNALSAEVAPRPAPALVVRAARAAPEPGPMPAHPSQALLNLRERVVRALTVFVVASVALYGALSLLRDIAGLIAVAAVAVLALLALYGVFRARVRRRESSLVFRAEG